MVQRYQFLTLKDNGIYGDSCNELFYTQKYWYIAGTLTFSRWSCRESMSRSPTGCQDPLNASAWRSFRSSSSMASWRPCSLSRASSIFFCQSADCTFSLSHSVLTSSACLCRSLVALWALSSGDRSKCESGGAFKTYSILELIQLPSR